MPCQASSQISVHLRRQLSSDSLLLPSSLGLQCELPVKAEGHMHLLALRVLDACTGGAASPEQTVHAELGYPLCSAGSRGLKFLSFSGNTKNMKPVSKETHPSQAVAWCIRQQYLKRNVHKF